MDSCGGIPIEGLDLIVNLKPAGISYEIKGHDSVGVGKTDAQGNFEMVCQYWRQGTYMLNIYSPKFTRTGNHAIFIDMPTKPTGKTCCAT